MPDSPFSPVNVLWVNPGFGKDSPVLVLAAPPLSAGENPDPWGEEGHQADGVLVVREAHGVETDWNMNGHPDV